MNDPRIRQVHNIISKLTNGNLSVDNNHSSQLDDLDEILNDLNILVDEQKSVLNWKKWFEGTLSSIDEAVIATDEKGDVIYVNRTAHNLTGWTNQDAHGWSIERVVSMIDEQSKLPVQFPIQEILKSSKPLNTQNQALLVTKSRKEIPVEYRISVIQNEKEFLGIVLVFQDIQLRTQIENELRQTQRMEALGTLAGSIAHDFNNILGAILGNTQMLNRNLKTDEKNSGYVKNILKAGQRATELIDQILTFSKMETARFSPLSLDMMLNEAIKMVKVALPTNVELKLEIEDNLDNIMANATQIQQIILNICTNSCHAMKEQGGTLSIALKQLKTPPTSLEMKHGPCLMLTIKDSGHGIPPENLKQIFDPFFTTKKSGTGLGLAIAYGIVENHNGKITIESEVGEGTTATLFFPVISEKKVKEELPTEDILARQGEGHILVIEDETFLSEIYKDFLESIGYQTTVCNNGSDAFREFEKNPDQFDLVFTDQKMPDITGMNLANKMLKIRSDIPILISTGDSSSVSKEEGDNIGVRGYLFKPVLLNELADLIKRSLTD